MIQKKGYPNGCVLKDTATLLVVPGASEFMGG